MRETYTTEQDVEFMKLRDKVFKVIPEGEKNGKKWRAFRDYMNFCYKKLSSHNDTLN